MCFKSKICSHTDITLTDTPLKVKCMFAWCVMGQTHAPYNPVQQ